MKIKDLQQGSKFKVANETYTITGYTEVDGQPYARCVKVWNGAPMLISVDVEVEDV